MTSSRTWTTRWGDRLLWVGALLGLVGIVLAGLAAVLDIRPLVVRSGSMEPEIATGALAFARTVDVREIQPDDVVSVVRDDGSRVTHRVVSVQPDVDAATLVMKGDANASVDPEPYRVQEAREVVLDVPYAGRVVEVATGPVGLVAAGVLVTVVVFLVARGSGDTRGPRRPGGDRRAPRARRHAATRACLALALAGTTAGAATTRHGEPTAASFTDAAALATGSFTALTIVSQAAPTCANVDAFLDYYVRLSWTKTDPRYEYSWQLIRTDGTVASSGIVGTSTASGGTVTLDVRAELLSTGSTYQVIVRAKAIGVATWVALTPTTTVVRRQNLAGIGLATRCL